MAKSPLLKTTLFFTCILICVCTQGRSQSPARNSEPSSQRILIHSHNDYRQRAPFWQAWSCGLASIEVDVFTTEDGRLLVAHDEAELTLATTLDELYLKPVIEAHKRHRSGGYQLLIDLKTPAIPTLDILIKKLSP